MTRQHTETVATRVEPKVKDELERMAWERNTTVGVIAREALSRLVDIEPRVFGPFGPRRVRSLGLHIR